MRGALDGGRASVKELLPGDRVTVRSPQEIAATLDDRQSLERLPFMPEMLQFCGQTFRVRLRADRACVNPPQLPLRRLDHAVTLEGVRCDGAFHGGCQLGCMILWKDSWLAEPSSPRDARRTEPVPIELRAKRTPESDVYFCQATDLIDATSSGGSFLLPAQYLSLLRHRTFTPRELVLMFGKPLARRLARLVGSIAPARGRRSVPIAPSLGLQSGDWIEVRSRDEIMASFRAGGASRGLAFGGDMTSHCGRQLRVAAQVERIVDERTGRLRTLRDTVTLDGAVCDRYLGCARGMPIMWREAWLKPIAPPSRSADHPRTGFASRRNRVAKRLIDILGAGFALTILLPVMLAITTLLLATQGRPILFRQVRPGLRGKPFAIVKFRTMRAPRNEEVWYLTDEMRLTRLGRFLRTTSLDEIPEFWNVLRGDMSLVGPRPLLVEYLDDYTPDEARRHEMRPGITGWAVVNGRNRLAFRDRLRFDVWYVDHWSLRLDVRILMATLLQVIRRQDAAVTERSELGFPLPGLGPSRMGESGEASRMGRDDGIASAAGGHTNRALLPRAASGDPGDARPR